jgi:hypothetical protein
LQAKQNKKIIMNIFLISNGSPDIYPNNTLTNFKNKLPTILELPENENWCVAIESIGFSTNFRNIDLPSNPKSPSFMLSNCQIDASKCEKMCIPHEMQTWCVTSDECQVKVNFKFEENEDNQNCFWDSFRFEDKFQSFDDMEAFFLKVRLKHKDAYIGLDPTQRFSISNIDVDKTGKDLWFLASESMISTFKIPKFVSVDRSTDYFKKVGMGQYQLIRKYYDFDYRTEVLHNELPYITYYNGEKYYAYRLKSSHAAGEEIHLVGGKKNHISNPKSTFPKLVKVVSENVEQQIFNSSYSKDLLCFCPDFNKEDKYFFHEFENRQYVPISNSMITDFNIKLVDDNNDYLQLLKGVPTIVKLDFKKMNIEEQFFNVRLTSARSENFPDNTKSSFKVKLPNTLSLDRSWKVCLTSISHPNLFKTFLADVNSRKILLRHKGNMVHQYLLEHKTYTKQDLINTLNKLLKESYVGSVSLRGNNLVFDFDQEDVEILASNYFFQIIGYNGPLDESKGFTLVKINEADNVDKFITDLKSHCEWNLALPPDVELLRPDYIISYANIVSPTIIGGLYSKILRVIPIKSSEMDYVVTEFHHKEYLELQNTEVNEIQIELRTHDGSLIEFGFEQDIILNLEFRLENKSEK